MSSTNIGKIALALAGAIGLCVLTGWMFGSEAMARVIPLSAPMSPNTALLFVAASIRLWPAHLDGKASYVRTIAGWVLVVLPCAILVESRIDFDVGLDWVALHRPLGGGNPSPVRTTPHAIAGFMLAALFLFLVDCKPTLNSRALQAIVALAAYGTLLIGVTALVGNLLDLDVLFKVEAINRMAAPSAIAMTLVGIGMKAHLAHAPWQNRTDAGSVLNRILKASATVLTFVAIGTGVTGFVVLKGSVDETKADAALQGTHYLASVLAGILDQNFLRARNIADSAVLREALSGSSIDPSNPVTKQSLRAVADTLIAAGMVQVAFFDVDGREIANAGTPMTPSPVISVAMNRGTTHGTLLWDDGFVLRTEEAVVDRGRGVGRLVAWQRLLTMTSALKNMRLENDSTDVLVCQREESNAVCFPSRFYPNLRVPLIVDGKPNLAISRALSGQKGVMIVDDARGTSVLAGYEPIGSSGLGLVLKTDSVDLYAPIRRRLNLLVALLALVIGGGTLLLRAHLRPLSRRLFIDHLAVKESEERLRVTLRSIGDAVITIDTRGRVSYLNPVAESMTGWSNDEARDRPLAEVFHIVNAETGELAPNPLEAVMQTKRPGALAEDTALIQRGGARFRIEDSAAPIINPLGKVIGAVLVFHDVTQAHAIAAEMTHQATHDPLTGLINRREFERRVHLSLQTAQVQGKDHSLLYLDLDQFKIINDRCGHGAGDELLRQLTSLLQDKLRKGDTLSRLGGDEFGVLLESCGAGPAHKIAEVLRTTVSGFRFSWEDKAFSLGVSIGLVTYSASGLTLANLMRMADSACYVAKDRGRNRIHVYTTDDDEVALRSGQMGWIGRVQQALEDERFVLYAQRIVALGDPSDRRDHFELLLRLRGEDDRLVPPMDFIPAAERYGLMPMLDRWVVSTAFARYETLPEAKRPGLCAINLSATSICDETFVPFIRDAFARHAVPPAAICFEISETAAMAHLKQARCFIQPLKAMGCRFALDDFGGGMSSFAYLKHLPVDFLKIDGELVKDMLDDPIHRAMVRSIHEIGHVMGLKTIAEFVESDAILAELRIIGVDFAQGYGIERPRVAW